MDFNYWDTAEDNWPFLKALIERYHPHIRGPAEYDKYSNFIAAEYACNDVRKMICQEDRYLGGPVEQAELALERKDGAIFQKIMNECWIGLPEVESVRRLPGFYSLCDLCSEDYE